MESTDTVTMKVAVSAFDIAPSNSISSTPKTRDQCSIYQNGTAAGTALYFLCSKVFPNGTWSNQMRGCLQSQYNPQSGYNPIPVPVTLPNNASGHGMTPATTPGVIDLNSLIPGTGAHLSCLLNPNQ